MHIAGRRQSGVISGMGLVLSRELMDSFLHSCKSTQKIVSQWESTPHALVATSRFPPLGPNLVALGRIAECNAGMISKSRLSESLVASEPFLESVTHETSILGANDPRAKGLTTVDIIMRNVNKGTEFVKDFDSNLVEPAIDACFLEFEKHPTRCTPRLLTISECVNGSSVFDNVKPIAMNTSEGFPYNQDRPLGTKGKRWMFSEVDDDDQLRTITYAPLRNDIAEYDLMVRQGTMPPLSLAMGLRMRLDQLSKSLTYLLASSVLLL
jgi:hypothetical protein